MKTETPDKNDYVYCEEHDIFFSPMPKGQTEEEREKLKACNLFCPMCQQDAVLTILCLHAEKPYPQRTLFQGSEDLSKI